MPLKRIAASVLLSCMVVFAAAQSGSNRSQTLFTINKKPVSTEEFIYLYRKNHQHKPEDFTKDKIEAYLNLFINYKLKVEEALFRGMDTTSAFRKEYQTYRDELLKPYLPDSKVIDSLVALTYERLKEEVNASHILVKLDPDASPADTLEAYTKISEIRMRAIAGQDFASLAVRHSEEPGASVSKGNLGFFTAMQMVFPFEQAAYQTPVGDVSMPVRTQFGYHIVKVLDRQPSRGEVEVSHIMIRAGDDTDNEEAKNTIFDIHDKLQKGMRWEELCEQYSEDANSKDSGGRLRPFGVGAMASVPQFQDMAFSLDEPGQISDPVQTQFGWHILRLESRIHLPSFEELKPSLTQRVSRDERVAISREALRKKMRAELGYVENASAKANLLTNADSILQNTDWLGAASENEILFTMQDQSYPVKGFVDYVAEHRSVQASGSSRQFLDQLFTRYVDEEQLRLTEEKVKNESPDYKWLLNEYYEGILLFEIMEKEVWNRAMEDTVGQREFFQEHAADYQADERMVGKIYSGSSKGNMEQLRNLLASQDSSVQEFISKHNIRQEAGSFEKNDRTILAKIEWSQGLYQASNNGVNYLIASEKILPPGPETFEEARASVISDYQTFLEDSWITELKRKFGVKVDKRARKQAFSTLMDR